MSSRPKQIASEYASLRHFSAEKHSRGGSVASAYTNIITLADQVPALSSRRKSRLRKNSGPALSSVDFALVMLREVLPVSHPRRPRQLITACTRLADWAHFCKEPGTALAYMQAAIQVQQDSPVYRAGREAAKQGLRSNAVSLFQRAIEYATAAEKWEEVAKSWTQLGRLYVIGKDYPLAEEAHGRALHVARKYGLKRREAHALHNLASLAVDRRDGLIAFMYARLAVDAYGEDYVGISSLANDVAYYWMVSEGAFKPALEVFEACVSYAEKPIDQMDMLANVARAAAGCGMVARYDEAALKVQQLAPEIKHKERVAGALLELAEGAYGLGRRESALQIAEQAKAMAAKRGERKYSAHADEVLRKIRKGGEILPTPPSTIHEIRNRDLAERLVRLLKAGRATKQ